MKVPSITRNIPRSDSGVTYKIGESWAADVAVGQKGVVMDGVAARYEVCAMVSNSKHASI